MKTKRTRTTLSNGLPLVVVEIPHSTSLAASFWTRAGDRANPVGKAGMAHFLEHLLALKTKNYPTDASLSEVLGRVGAIKNGSTSKDWMNLNIASPAKEISLVLSVLAQMAFSPRIDKKGFDSERKVIFQEQARKKSRTEELASAVWSKLFFNPSPLTVSGLGDERSLGSIEIVDVLEFWNKFFHADNNLLFLSGGISPKDVFEQANRTFGRHEVKKAEPVPVYTYQDVKRVLIERKLLPQAFMVLSFRIDPADFAKDVHALILLKSILAGGNFSRIFQRLRVKESLIYNMGSSIQRFIDTAAYRINLSTSNDKFNKMISVLCEEIVGLREKGISKSELEFHKGFLQGRILAEFETSLSYVDWYASYELLWPDEVESPEERIARINKVTLGDIERIAKKYLRKDNWHLAVVGDVREKDIKVEL